MSAISSKYDPARNNDFASRSVSENVLIVHPKVDTQKTDIIDSRTKLFPLPEKLKDDKINTTINNWKNGNTTMVIDENTYQFVELKRDSNQTDTLYEYILDSSGNIKRSSKQSFSVYTWDEPLLFNEDLPTYNEEFLDDAINKKNYEFGIGSLAMESTNADAYVLIAFQNLYFTENSDSATSLNFYVKQSDLKKVAEIVENIMKNL